MKKTIFLAAFGLIALTACKKDYSCSCQYSGINYYDSNFDGIDEAHPYSGTSNYTVEGANKTQAQAACNEATIKQNDDGDTYEETCTLSK